jgi:hypothetical protein
VAVPKASATSDTRNQRDGSWDGIRKLPVYIKESAPPRVGQALGLLQPQSRGLG